MQNIPKGPSLAEGLNTISTCVIVGDEHFGLSNFLLLPYRGNFLSVQRRVFSYLLMRARR
jgi:hypothetical protein